MPKRKMIPLAFMGLIGTAVVVLVAVFILRAWWTTPFHVFGLGASPEQPIAFPHTVHVQSGINCAFCHRNVTKGDAATVPAVEQCLFCHQNITGNGNPEIAKVVASFNQGEPINWELVHRLPDHVQFTHEPHIRFLTQQKGLSIEVSCATCHGNVGEMTKVEQVRSLKMGDCLDCHRENLPLTDNKNLTDCAACHY